MVLYAYKKRIDSIDSMVLMLHACKMYDLCLVVWLAPVLCRFMMLWLFHGCKMSVKM